MIPAPSAWWRPVWCPKCDQRPSLHWTTHGPQLCPTCPTEDLPVLRPVSDRPSSTLF